MGGDGNKQISPKRTGPLKAMVSSCRGLDACSGLAAAAGILLLLCLQGLFGADHCRIEAPRVCSLAYPHIASHGVGGWKQREGEMSSAPAPLTLAEPPRGEME